MSVHVFTCMHNNNLRYIDYIEYKTQPQWFENGKDDLLIFNLPLSIKTSHQGCGGN